MVDPATLPPDAVFKGYETGGGPGSGAAGPTRSRSSRRSGYSPSERRSYRARRPAGYAGTVGPHLRALVLTLALCRRDERAEDHGAVEGTGLVLLAGTLSTLLTEGRVTFEPEAHAVLKAGLASTPYQHLDDTSTRVDGELQYCQILCNALYTAYLSLPRRRRGRP